VRQKRLCQGINSNDTIGNRTRDVITNLTNLNSYSETLAPKDAYSASQRAAFNFLKSQLMCKPVMAILVQISLASSLLPSLLFKTFHQKSNPVI
jgi:hypothetical protein